jgi:hypothetical protein
MSIKWNNANLKIRSSFMPERLWLGATIDVVLGETTILATRGKLKFQGACTEQFEHLGQQHQIKLEWGTFWMRSVPCTVYIDNQLVAQETVNIENWQLNIVGLILFFFLVVGLCSLLLFIGQMVVALLL